MRWLLTDHSHRWSFTRSPTTRTLNLSLDTSRKQWQDCESLTNRLQQHLPTWLTDLCHQRVATMLKIEKLKRQYSWVRLHCYIFNAQLPNMFMRCCWTGYLLEFKGHTNTLSSETVQDWLTYSIHHAEYSLHLNHTDFIKKISLTCLYIREPRVVCIFGRLPSMLWLKRLESMTLTITV